MSYLVLKPRSKKEEALIKQFAELLNLDYKSISVQRYLRDIVESRQQFKAGKKISLKDLEDGI